MKASEFAAQIMRMVAEWGDHEIGVHGNELPDGPVADLIYCCPCKRDREEGAQPRYLIEWYVGPRLGPVLNDVPVALGDYNARMAKLPLREGGGPR